MEIKNDLQICVNFGFMPETVAHINNINHPIIKRWVTSNSLIARIKELGKNKIEDEDGVEIKYWHFDESDLALLEKELEGK